VAGTATERRWLQCGDRLDPRPNPGGARPAAPPPSYPRGKRLRRGREKPQTGPCDPEVGGRRAAWPRDEDRHGSRAGLPRSPSSGAPGALFPPGSWAGHPRARASPSARAHTHIHTYTNIHSSLPARCPARPRGTRFGSALTPRDACAGPQARAHTHSRRGTPKRHRRPGPRADPGSADPCAARACPPLAQRCFYE
jgi:hypothetical protein